MKLFETSVDNLSQWKRRDLLICSDNSMSEANKRDFQNSLQSFPSDTQNSCIIFKSNLKQFFPSTRQGQIISLQLSRNVKPAQLQLCGVYVTPVFEFNSV